VQCEEAKAMDPPLAYKNLDELKTFKRNKKLVKKLGISHFFLSHQQCCTATL